MGSRNQESGWSEGNARLSEATIEYKEAGRPKVQDKRFPPAVTEVTMERKVSRQDTMTATLLLNPLPFH